MLAAGRTYCVARSSLSASRSRCGRLGLVVTDSSPVTRGVRLACQQYRCGSFSPPSYGEGTADRNTAGNRSPTRAAAAAAAWEPKMAWLQYQDGMHRRTGLMKRGPHPWFSRREEGGGMGRSASSNEGGIDKDGGISGMSNEHASSLTPAAAAQTPASATTPTETTTTATSDTNGAISGGSTLDSSHGWSPAPVSHKPPTLAAAAGSAVEPAKISTASAGSRSSVDIGSTITSSDSIAAEVAASSPSNTAPAVIPRSAGHDGDGSSTDRVALIAELERSFGKRITGGAGAQSGSSSREAALNAELERKFGKNPDGNPEPGSAGGWWQAESSAQKEATGSELRGSGAVVAARDPSSTNLSSVGAVRPEQGRGSGWWGESEELEKSGSTGRRKRARKIGRRGGGRKVDVDGTVSAIDGTVSQGWASELHRGPTGGGVGGGGAPAGRPQADDVELVVGISAPEDGAGERTTTGRRGRRGKSASTGAAAASPPSSESADSKGRWRRGSRVKTEGGERGERYVTEKRQGGATAVRELIEEAAPALAVEPAPSAPAAAAEGGAGAGGGGGGGGGTGEGQSHYQKQRSAWKNVHAKKRMNLLLKGLDSDYGVQQMLGAHHISRHTMSKVLPIFRELVFTDPDKAFPGGAGQTQQTALTELCSDVKFRADAVLMKRPIMITTPNGRSFDLSSGQAKGRKEAPFIRKRNELVQKAIIPRLIELAQDNFPSEIADAQRMGAIVDLRNPQHAFPLARLRKRRIIYHGGPTNSGKTYQAIERLKKAGANQQPGAGPSGLFCGPLRLLALEVYEQLNSQGVYCSLMTGQEKREVPFATHVSCTIEMASTTNEYEVAVIDEIQMLADEQRGPSWTAALLGLNCPEIHVCGGMEGAALVEAMAKEMGDEFELKEYERKTKLVCAEESLGGSYKNIQPGDAVVAFSRKDIFSIKKNIEAQTPHKCCVIYGSLPQETRAHQARLFNSDDTGYDVLVASDAIGMGLNLNIRRVVFHAVSKRNGAGRGISPLPPTVLKQIGGRAGRHGKGYAFGEVTCLRASDMPYMTKVMNTPLESIPKAAIFPSVQRMQEFSNCLDQTEPEDHERRRLAETFAAFADRANVGDRYFLGTHDQYQTLANTLHPIENLSLKERHAISMAPVNGRDALLVRAIFLFASAHAAGLPVFINMRLPQKGVLPKSMPEFQMLCSKHNVLDLYKWMGVRFPSIECFAERSVAEIQRLELESIINAALKQRIAVDGPGLSGAPEHDTFDKQVLRALSDPNGGVDLSLGGRAEKNNAL